MPRDVTTPSAVQELVENKTDKENQPLPPRKQAAASTGSHRYKPDRWEKCEQGFVWRCFNSDPCPPSAMFEEWASKLTDKKLRRLGVDNDECITQEWESFYNRRLRNWFKNTRAKLRRQSTSAVAGPTIEIESSPECRAQEEIEHASTKAPTNELIDNVNVKELDPEVVEAAKILMSIKNSGHTWF